MIDEFRAAQIQHELESTLLEVKERLKPIADGEITRGHCIGNRECYGGKPGLRKTTLKDARSIAKHAIAYIDQMVSRDHR